VACQSFGDIAARLFQGHSAWTALLTTADAGARVQRGAAFKRKLLITVGRGGRRMQRGPLAFMLWLWASVMGVRLTQVGGARCVWDRVDRLNFIPQTLQTHLFFSSRCFTMAATKVWTQPPAMCQAHSTKSSLCCTPLEASACLYRCV